MDFTVYVMINDSGYVVAINSSAFLSDPTGWVKIDRGTGDRYHHAQNNYFGQPIRTESGVYRYKLVDGQPVECTAEEIAAQEEANKPVPAPTTEERLKELESQNQMLMECLLEMSETVYA